MPFRCAFSAVNATMDMLSSGAGPRGSHVVSINFPTNLMAGDAPSTEEWVIRQVANFVTSMTGKHSINNN